MFKTSIEILQSQLIRSNGRILFRNTFESEAINRDAGSEPAPAACERPPALVTQTCARRVAPTEHSSFTSFDKM
ncbi:jg20706 [Pararge aegeria aegeria]|uniref:Jg20706 protein n=1 Tax=Pararge aegeria aegeria TaxID=348720 RepID=A0A8S4QMF6_9NEOP|nr:jg20706 [Pararge aegeria aegeria]